MSHGASMNPGDVVLDLKPISPDNNSDEAPPEKEEEEQAEACVATRRSQYTVHALCGSCSGPVVFKCVGNRPAIITLQELLFEELQLLCLKCAQRDGVPRH